jgi:plasmid maintenance system antidote protein VapI
MNKILKAKIIEKFGTQADFAQAVNTDESIVSRVVRGRRSLHPETQRLWAKKIGCKPNTLFQNGGENLIGGHHEFKRRR